MIALSIIIVTRNSAHAITACLESLRTSLAGRRDCEIIVIDNASTDETAEIIAGTFPSAKLSMNNKNVGFAAAVNQVATLSTGQTLLLLNPDTTMHQNFIPALFSFIDRTSEAAIIGCGMLDDHGAHQPSCWKRPNLRTAFLESALPHIISLRLVTDFSTRMREVDMVSGGCMAIRKKVFEDLGGFDERFFLYYEDADLCLRAKQSGHKIFFLPDAKVFHRVRQSSSNDNVSFFRNIYTSKLAFFRKHSSMPVYYLVSLIVIAGIMIRVPTYFIAGLIVRDRHLRDLSKYHYAVLSSLIGWEK